MYVCPNFKTKKALKDAVKAGECVQVYQPGLGPEPPDNGIVYGIEGPHAPEPHKWYAEVTVAAGVVVKVK